MTHPSLIGWRPAEAAAYAAAQPWRIVWVEAPPPRWLPPCHEPRVGRQRIRPDGAVELLRVLIPSVAEAPDVRNER